MKSPDSRSKGPMKILMTAMRSGKISRRCRSHHCVHSSIQINRYSPAISITV
jgi:hypothetical protein